MCDPVSLAVGGGGLLGKAREKRKERKAEAKMFREAEEMKQPVSKATAPKQQTKMNTGIKIGGQY